MTSTQAIAIVGMGAILPDATDAPTFWQNILERRYSIHEVPHARWNPSLYFDPDPAAPDKTYTKIGGWVNNFQFDPFKLKLAIPPKLLTSMDEAQQWGLAAAHQALTDYGYPQRPLDNSRVAVILGNALAGEGHYNSSMRIRLPEYLQALSNLPDFQSLPRELQARLLDGMSDGIRGRVAAISEDTMPGELANIIAGRIANLFNFAGPNFVTDAACASSLAAVESAVQGLLAHRFDAALAGGVDRSMGPESFVKFCKIGALSPDGSRPYAEGANGFVMGEGAALFLLKRLEDAEKDGDTIYAVIRALGSSSDGKGKGITAPNPLGQQRAVERAWQNAGLSLADAGLIEGHGTSTRVGDLAEVSTLISLFSSLGLPEGSIGLGSVKSNIGHLKSAAGAAGILKAALALHHKILPPTANFERPNPGIDFAHSPFTILTAARPWDVKEGQVRRAGVSAFGFGGTNFHAVLEEYRPGVLMQENKSYPAVTLQPAAAEIPAPAQPAVENAAAPAVSVDRAAIQQTVLGMVSEKTGYPVEMLDLELDLEADLGIDTVKQAELFAAIREQYGIPRREDLRLADYNSLNKVIQFVEEGLAQSITLPRPVGVDPRVDPVAPIASPVESDAAPAPYHGLLFLGAASESELATRLNAVLEDARRGVLPANRLPDATQLAQPERLAIDYGDAADLIKRGEKALKALQEGGANWQMLTSQSIYRGSGTPGKVAFMFPGQGSQYLNMLRDLGEVEPLVAETFREADAVMTPILGKPLTGYIFVDGDEAAQAQAEKELRNTAITQPAMLTVNVALMRVLNKFGFQPDMVIGHSLGEYAALVAAGVLTFAEALQVVSARGREMTRINLDDNGCMAAVSARLEAVQEILKTIEGYVVIANLNSPLQCVIGGSTPAVDAALQAFAAANIQATKIPVSHAFHTQIVAPASVPLRGVIDRMNVQAPRLPIMANVTGELYPTQREEILDILAAQVASPVQFIKGIEALYAQGARVFVEVGPKRVLCALATDILKGREDAAMLSTNHPRKGGLVSFNEALCALLAAGLPAAAVEVPPQAPCLISPEMIPVMVQSSPTASPTISDGRLPLTGSVVISGAGLGLPGRDRHVFRDDNIQSLLRGDNRIEPFDESVRQVMLHKRVTRLVKSDAGAVMQVIDDPELTVKLAGQTGAFDPAEEFGIPADRLEATDIATQLAIAAGIEALRDAGIPLVMAYKKTSTGSLLPDRWRLPAALADETGVIFASAFPGLDRMANEAESYSQYLSLSKQLEQLQSLRALVPADQSNLSGELKERITALQDQLAELNYNFDRRFVFRVLAMGHSQFAEHIGARGPNTHVNAACASTTHAVAVAEDWIRAGRARRVVIVSGDDITGGSLSHWIPLGMLASGAATTEGDPRQAILPFDRRRNGMIMGMGAAALVVESEDALRERGMRAICEVLSTQIANSAFHGTRLDVNHVSQVMERLVQTAEQRFCLQRSQIAGKTVFISHETYTPARGGSAAAEIHALRNVFGEQANRVIIANTKGYTGHTMGVGVEDVLAVKALQFGVVPPIANIQDGFEPDPELGDLNLSQGGEYNPDYALRLGAGFGSQVAMTLLRRIPGAGERVQQPVYNHWLGQIAGYTQADLEVTQRTLRIRHTGAPVNAPAPSNWQYGQGPTMWANVPQAATPKATPLSKVEPQKIEAAEPVAAAEPVSTPAPVMQAAGEDVQAYVLQAVSEKTGYPVEMLDLELDLEADLGVDTVKQAELFATLREHFGIPRREDLRLSDYNTLAKVIDFMKQAVQPQSAVAQTPVAVQAVVETVAAPAAQPVAVTTVVTADEDVQAYVLNAVSEKTGYPVEMLDLELDLEADLGVDTVKQAELFAALREHFGIPRREDLRLSDYNTLSKVIAFMQQAVQPQAVVAETPAVLETIVETVAAPTVQPVAETTVAASDEDVQAYVLQAVSEKTGYPVEMLDLELDLEADLGVDTVKQAELFAALREHFGIPRREDLRLSDYNTLAKVIDFMQQAVQPQEAFVEQPTEDEATPASPVSQAAMPETKTIYIPRRVPVPSLRMRLALSQPTGVQLDKNSRVLIITGQDDAGISLADQLKSRKVQVSTLSVDTPDLVEKVQAFVNDAPLQGVYFLPALTPVEDLLNLTPEQWQTVFETRLHALVSVVRVLPGQSFVVGATRMGGLHGYGGQPAVAPEGGAVSGFLKALARERSDALIKVVDFASAESAAVIAEALIDETLADPAVVEVGWQDGLRFGITLAEQPIDTAQEKSTIQPGTVYLVTGGTAGILPPILLNLAQTAPATFYLLSRTALPAVNDPDLVLLKTDRDALKRMLMQRLTDQGEKATPALIEQRIAVLERSAATLAAIDRLTSLGSQVHYLECDVTQPEAVRNAAAQVVQQAGKVDVLIHAAGQERSRKLDSKPEAEFRQVFSVKADGFFHTFKALEGLKALPHSMVLFSSVAGRFGNSGQTDYAAANDLLCKLSSALRSQYPAMRTITIDWGAWGEVGMASRGHIPALMERAGIEMMPPAQAAALLRAELENPTSNGEVLLAGSLGLMEAAQHADGGLDAERANAELRAGNPIHQMFSQVTRYDLQDGIILEADVDPTIEPFLRDHALNGIPVLPGVIGIEGFSVAARHIASVLASDKQGFIVSQLEDVQFKLPFKFYRNEPRRITWKARVIAEQRGLVVYASLESTLKRPDQHLDVLEHFTGRVILEHAGAEPQAHVAAAPHWNGHATVGSDDIYRLYFHGPAFQVLDGVQCSGDTVLGRLNQNLPPATSDGRHLSTPTLVELCFQTAGIWEAGVTGVLALPQSIGSLHIYRDDIRDTSIFAEVTPLHAKDGSLSFNARVLDENGNIYLEIKNYHTSPLPYAAEPELIAPLKVLLT